MILCGVSLHQVSPVEDGDCTASIIMVKKFGACTISGVIPRLSLSAVDASTKSLSSSSISRSIAPLRKSDRSPFIRLESRRISIPQIQRALHYIPFTHGSLLLIVERLKRGLLDRQEENDDGPADT